MRRFEPLKRVRVLAFEAAFSLPAGTRTLAELGAEVVQVSRPERVSSDYITLADGNTFSKSSLAVNLQHEEGRVLARRLAAAADVVCNNFRPRVMEKYGLDAASLHALNPGLIVLQLSGYGATGPWREYPAYGPSVEAAGGMNALSGTETDPPVRVGSGVFADQASGRYAALALIAALERRRITGKGQYIDLSMYESVVHLLGNALLSTTRPGRSPVRHGNRDAVFVPQGVYPCAGEDEWVALTVKTDAAWQALRDLLGDPRLCDTALESAEGRRRCHDLIDAAIAAWTCRRDKRDAAAALQQHGIASGPVHKPGDLPVDPHLAARGTFSTVQHVHPHLGAAAHPHLTTPWQAEGYARHALRDTPGDGAHSEQILRRWLGLRRAELTRLRKAGAVMPFRRFRIIPPPLPPGTPVDDEFATRLGLPPAGGGGQ